MAALSERIKNSVIGDWFDGAFSTQSSFMRQMAKINYGGEVRVRFYRKLAVLVKNGKRLQSCVDDIHSRALKRGKTDAEAIVLTDVADQMRRGLSFGASLRGYVPLGESILIQAGEKGGTLPQSLEMAATMIIASQKMKKAVTGAILYPVGIFSFAAGFLVFFSIKVIPAFSTAIDPDLWTGVAKALYLTSKFVVSPWAVALLGFIFGISLLIGLSMKRWSGGFRSKFDTFPPWSFYRLMVGGGWLMSLAALLNAGTTLSEAIATMKQAARDPKNGSPWLHERLARTSYHLTQGLNLGRALEATKTGFPDQEIVEDLVFYSDMPELDRVLLRVGQEWVETGVEKVQAQAAILRTAAICAVGGVVGFLVYGFITMQSQISAVANAANRMGG